MANALYNYDSKSFNRASIMRRAHAMIAEQRATWPKLYKGQSYTQIFASCLSAAWQEARLAKVAAPKPSQDKTDALQAQVIVLRNRETSRINHQNEIADLNREIALLHLEAA